MMMMRMIMMMMIMTIESVEQRPGWGEHVLTGFFCCRESRLVSGLASSWAIGALENDFLVPSWVDEGAHSNDENVPQQQRWTHMEATNEACKAHCDIP